MSQVPELSNLLPVSCAVCGNDRMQVTLGKRSGNTFYIRVACPEHGVMIQFRLHNREMERWARQVMARNN